MYIDGYLSGDSEGVIDFALDVFQYRRLDWVDSYLIAREIVLHEPFTTFDFAMMKTAAAIKTHGNKIPVVSSYTLSVNDLPANVFIRAADRKDFVRQGLLAAYSQGEDWAASGIKEMSLDR